ncbi:lipase/acyltransferase domain-containing protein [Maridesulfovibrio sp.]|uniref:lipase/acyltransferase domain-containing protein n=1 Tax=Maridesulfovibrio sp. TaxID=2795000 RepID=UPI002A18A393|nr:alpha/beta fold hydrolase [Maridesulfovibrio sp.]
MFRDIERALSRTFKQAALPITFILIAVITTFCFTGCGYKNLASTEKQIPITIAISSEPKIEHKSNYARPKKNPTVIEKPFLLIEFSSKRMKEDELYKFISDTFSVSFDGKTAALGKEIFQIKKDQSKLTLNLAENMVVGHKIHKICIISNSNYKMTVTWNSRELPEQERGFEFEYITDVNSPQNPIYFLPGILGSIICDKNDNTVWDADGEYFTSERLLQLHRHNGEDSYPSGNLKACGIIGLESEGKIENSAHTYKNFLKNFPKFSEDNNFPYQKESTETPEQIVASKASGKYGSITPFAYDWRLSFPEIIKSLHNSLTKKLKPGDKKITLIGHSLGGLIAYFYANDFVAGCKGSDYVKHVIMISSPLSGSIQAGMALRQGVPAIIKDDLLSLILGKPVSIILTRSFPSLYYLLPHVRFNPTDLSSQIHGSNAHKKYIENLINESAKFWDMPKERRKNRQELTVPSANIISVNGKKNTFAYDLKMLEGELEKGKKAGDGTVSIVSLSGMQGECTKASDLGRDETSPEAGTVTIYNISNPKFSNYARKSFYAEHSNILDKNGSNPLYYYIKDLLWKNAYNNLKEIPTVKKTKTSQNETTILKADENKIEPAKDITTETQKSITDKYSPLSECLTCLKDKKYTAERTSEKELKVILKRNGTLGSVAQCIPSISDNSCWSQLDILHKSYNLAEYNLTENNDNFAIGTCTNKSSKDCFKYENAYYDLSKIEENSTIIIPENYNSLCN